MVIEDNSEKNQNQNRESRSLGTILVGSRVGGRRNGLQETTGECRRDRACVGIIGRIGRLGVMTEIWKTGVFSLRVECLIEGRTPGQVRRLEGWKGVHGESRTQLQKWSQAA